MVQCFRNSASTEAVQGRDKVSSTRTTLEMKLYHNGAANTHSQSSTDSSAATDRQSMERSVPTLAAHADINNDNLQPSLGSTFYQLSSHTAGPAIQYMSVARESSIPLHNICDPNFGQHTARQAAQVTSNWHATESQTTESRNTTPSDDDYRQFVDYRLSPQYFNEMPPAHVCTAREIIHTPATIPSQHKAPYFNAVQSTIFPQQKPPYLLPHGHVVMSGLYASTRNNVYSSMNDMSVTSVSSRSPSSVLSSEEPQQYF